MSTSRYPIPAQRHRVEEEISRSRFITTVAPAATVDEARTFIAEVSGEFADASHNCWAYVVGSPGSSAQAGMSDDGEPHGTAGMPMLNVLLHTKIGDICVVVTRYFGGTLLGKGGLVRAYSGGVQLALESLPTVERVEKEELIVVVEYAAITPIKRVLSEFEAEVQQEEYATDVTFQLSVPTANSEALIAVITEITNGQALIKRG